MKDQFFPLLSKCHIFAGHRRPDNHQDRADRVGQGLKVDGWVVGQFNGKGVARPDQREGRGGREVRDCKLKNNSPRPS